MKEKPRSSTSNPSGTMMSIPPQKATAVISTSGPSISARRRSMSHPPMTATALVFPLMRQRPLVLCPLMTATCQRRFFLARCRARAGDRRSERACGRSAMTASEVAPGPGLEGRPTRSENSSSVSRPSTTCSRSWVTVRSRSASATRSVSAPRSPSGGRWAVGNWQVRHMDSLPAPPGSGPDLTTRQIGLAAPVRLVAPCEASSVRRATCPTGGWPGRTSRPSWAAAAARGPGPWPPTTRTPPPWGSRRPAWPCAPPRATPPMPSGSPPPARLSRQDERNCGCRGTAAAGRRRRLRLRGRVALGHGLPDCGAARRRDRSWSWPGTCATACPRARTSPPAATPAPPCWSGTGPGCWPSSSPRPRPPTSSPTAGGRRATASPSCGRSASARTATWRWARMPWPGR